MMNLQQSTIEEITEMRNEIVKKWVEEKQPLRTKRENQEIFTEEDWNEWDRMDREMNIKIAPIDHQLFRMGAM